MEVCRLPSRCSTAPTGPGDHRRRASKPLRSTCRPGLLLSGYSRIKRPTQAAQRKEPARPLFLACGCVLHPGTDNRVRPFDALFSQLRAAQVVAHYRQQHQLAATAHRFVQTHPNLPPEQGTHLQHASPLLGTPKHQEEPQRDPEGARLSWKASPHGLCNEIKREQNDE